MNIIPGNLNEVVEFLRWWVPPSKKPKYTRIDDAPIFTSSFTSSGKYWDCCPLGAAEMLIKNSSWILDGFPMEWDAYNEMGIPKAQAKKFIDIWERSSLKEQRLIVKEIWG